MPNKKLQEERMKGYFIQATKEILKGEGLSAVNVRTIAERAGYSFATLYNYFKDSKELIFLCAKDFLIEAEEYANAAATKDKSSKEKLIAYTRYMIQYPGVFELLYIEKPGDLKAGKELMTMAEAIISRLSDNALESVNTTEKQLKTQLLNSLITGLLVLYLNRRTPDNYSEFIKRLEESLDHILM